MFVNAICAALPVHLLTEQIDAFKNVEAEPYSCFKTGAMLLVLVRRKRLQLWNHILDRRWCPKMFELVI